MKKVDKHKGANSRLFGRFAFCAGAMMLVGVGFLTLCVFSPRSPRVGLLFVFLALLVSCVAIVVWDGVSEKRRRRAKILNARRGIRKRKASENVRAQLQKPDFETRLRAFAKTDGDHDQPESKMEFWEREEDYALTPTRPIELLRYLLQRVSKLVGQSR